MKKFRIIVLLTLLLVLPACQSQSLPGFATQTPLPTSTLTATATATLTATATATATETVTPTFTPTPVPQVRRVLILSIDGLRPHRLILESIRARDAEGVEQLVREHILRGQKMVLNAFASKGLR